MRQRQDVAEELNELCFEINESNTIYNRIVGVRDLFKMKEFRWPLLTSMLLHASQQLCGINTVRVGLNYMIYYCFPLNKFFKFFKIFFYSSDIFKRAGIKDDYIQYAILSTGLAEFLTLFVCMKLIEKVGRKPLTIVSISVIIVNFIALVLFLSFKVKFNFKKIRLSKLLSLSLVNIG